MDTIKPEDAIHYEFVKQRKLRAECPLDSSHRAIVRGTDNSGDRVRRCYCFDCERPFKMVGPSSS
jgi:hypothetical protein